MKTMSDRESIRDLTNRYAYYADTFQLDLLTALWAKDGVFDETAADNGFHSGQANVRKFFEGLRVTIRYMAHFVTNQIIEELSSTGANGIVFSYVRAISSTGAAIESCCYYKDDYVKADGRWIFQSRVLGLLLPNKIVDPRSK